jgi:MFS family permease
VASRYRFYVLGLMVGIALLNYMDRWVGSAVAPLIQAEFDLNDFSIGLLGIGEASYFPAGTSLLGDSFPRQERGRTLTP